MNHLFPLFLNFHFFQACRAMYFAPFISGLCCGFLNAFLPGTAPGGTGLPASLHACTLLATSCCLRNSQAKTQMPTFVDIDSDLISQTSPPERHQLHWNYSFHKVISQWCSLPLDIPGTQCRRCCIGCQVAMEVTKLSWSQL